MRIVYLRSNPVNPDSRVEKEVNSLIKSGHEVVVLGWDRGNNYGWRKEKLILTNGTVDIYRIGIEATFGGGMRNLGSLYKFNSNLYRWLLDNSNSYDCIHAADLDTGLTAYRVCKKKHKKYVYDIFDYYPAAHKFPKILREAVIKAEMKTINNAEFVIICTDQRKEQIEGTNPKKLVIIHNSPSRDILESANESFSIASNRSNVIRIGYVGILSKSRLLEEIVNVVQKNNDFEFHVGGFGLLEGFFRKVSEETKNIFFYGKLKYSDALQLEKQMDVLTAIYDPSVSNHKYAAPNKFYESLMLGKPVIMIHGTGVDGIVDEYGIGVTIDFSAEGFESAIHLLRDKSKQWDEIAMIEADMFDKLYSWDIMDKRLVDAYSGISL